MVPKPAGEPPTDTLPPRTLKAENFDYDLMKIIYFLIYSRDPETTATSPKKSTEKRLIFNEIVLKFI